jgi:hypothetical protein
MLPHNFPQWQLVYYYFSRWIFDKLIFVNKVETGLLQSANGQVDTTEQAGEK